jgi:phage/plasmid-associated DNA primase
MGRQRFAFPSSVERAREQYRQTLDTVRAFITEECHFDPDAWIDRAELYRRYKEWCREGGRYDLAAATFNARLPQAYPGRIGQRTRRGRPGWRGLDIGVAAPEGDRGDEGDEFPTLSNRARARDEIKMGTASPPSPRPSREPGEDDCDELPFPAGRASANRAYRSHEEGRYAREPTSHPDL